MKAIFKYLSGSHNTREVQDPPPPSFYEMIQSGYSALDSSSLPEPSSLWSRAFRLAKIVQSGTDLFAVYEEQASGMSVAVVNSAMTSLPNDGSWGPVYLHAPYEPAAGPEPKPAKIDPPPRSALQVVETPSGRLIDLKRKPIKG